MSGLWNVYYNPLMRWTDNITIVGYNGDRCPVSGKDMKHSWGPLLAPGSTGLFEPPVRTNWGPGMLGQRFESWSPQRRDVVFTMHIVAPRTGENIIDTNPALWHDIYSRFRQMFSYDYESTIVYESLEGERRLKVRLLKEPTPFAAQQFEGRDPHLFKYGSITMAVAAENPYYVGKTEKFAYEWDGNGDHWFKIPFYNPGTVMIWPRWYLEYGRGLQDEGKTVRVPGIGDRLLAGENTDVFTTPEEETFRAENDAPVGNRMNGKDFEYPIQPGCGAPPSEESHDDWATVRMINVTNPAGARVELDLDRWYAEPFGTALVA